MKFVSWNVNGLRAILKKGFNEFLESQDPDFICLQEIKARPEQVEGLKSEDFYCYWNPAIKKGYSGTALFSKEEPLKITYGLGIPEHDDEGRLITAEYPDFYLVTTYVPNSKRELERLAYRQKWDQDLRLYLTGLKTHKPVILCGDLNVAHQEIDLANPKTNLNSAGFTTEERQGFSDLLDSGFTDSFRYFNKHPHHYTWWSNFHQARNKNIGWRIDYFCVSNEFMPNVASSRILADVRGSDHCPVVINLK